MKFEKNTTVAVTESLSRMKGEKNIWNRRRLILAAIEIWISGKKKQFWTSKRWCLNSQLYARSQPPNPPAIFVLCVVLIPPIFCLGLEFLFELTFIKYFKDPQNASCVWPQSHLFNVHAVCYSGKVINLIHRRIFKRWWFRKGTLTMDISLFLLGRIFFSLFLYF